MPRARSITTTEISTIPKVLKITITHIWCIGATPVSIDIDNIVVLVWPNNSWKSTILKIYECIMGKWKIDQGDIHLEQFDELNPPTVEIISLIDPSDHLAVWEHFLINDPKWKLIKERWIFNEHWVWKRQWRNELTKERMGNWPLWADNVAKWKRPIPIRINAFDSPEKQTTEINKLIKEVLLAKIKTITNPKGENLYDQLIWTLKDFQKTIKVESDAEITKIEEELSEYLSQIFTNHSFTFEAWEETGLEDQVSFFQTSELKVNWPDWYKAAIDKQGSWSRRTILWSILKYQNDKKRDWNRPFILLIDEPELCLHPSAIRESCNVLYSLANSEWWQVMITTHSPQFIDLSKDNTTIVRVERWVDEKIQSTILFRPTSANLDKNDKENLKLLNMFDPYVAEFFFWWKVIVVEWDTEYSVFKYIIEKEWYKNIHVIRARWKSTIISLMKILNHFWTNYSVLHDTDEMTCERKWKTITNPAWTVNNNILSQRSDKTRLIASKVTFELAYFWSIPWKDKPYSAVLIVKESEEQYEKIKSLLNYLLDKSVPIPNNAVEWDKIKDIENFFNT